MDVLFSIRNLKVTAHGQSILSIAELDLPKGKSVTIIGPNGAGKSTLLKALLGLNGGKISLNGMDIHKQIKQGMVAWVGQHGQFNLPLTVAEYVQLGCGRAFGQCRTDSKNNRQSSQLLEEFDLLHLAKQRISSLSGGEQQRANIVRALLQKASVLLLDEPCNHLDIRHQHRLMNYLQMHRSDFSVVMVLHDLTMAANYADFAILMNQGGIVAAGAVDKVMQTALLSRVYQWPIESVSQHGEIFFRMAMTDKSI